MVVFFSPTAATQNRKTKCAAVTDWLAPGSLPRKFEAWASGKIVWLFVLCFAAMCCFYLLLWSTKEPWELGQWKMDTCFVFLFVVWMSSCPVLCNYFPFLLLYWTDIFVISHVPLLKHSQNHDNETILGFNWVCLKSDHLFPFQLCLVWFNSTVNKTFDVMPICV